MNQTDHLTEQRIKKVLNVDGFVMKDKVFDVIGKNGLGRRSHHSLPQPLDLPGTGQRIVPQDRDCLE